MQNSSSNIEIRPEVAGDIEVIADLTHAAFRHKPYSSGTEQFIVNALRRNGQLTLSLVAVDGTQVVGHVAVSPVTISTGTTGWFGLGPISVSPARQGQGIGSMLMGAALTALRRDAAHGCVVLGDPAYYGRFGFKVYANLVLPDVPREFFQALPFSDDVPAGEVAFHESFNAKK